MSLTKREKRMLRARLIQGMMAHPELFWKGRTIQWSACKVCGAPTLQASACQPNGSWKTVGSPSGRDCWDTTSSTSPVWVKKTQILYEPRFDVID